MRMKYLPGTTIQADFDRRPIAESMLGPIFIADGLVLSQVSQLTGLEPHTVQNWVKRGFVSPPRSKKYSKRQFCRIVIINFLKSCFQIDEIVRLLVYINNDMADEDDDRIDDNLLYDYFVDALSLLSISDIAEGRSGGAIKSVSKDFCAKQPEDRERLERVLSIMLAAYVSATMKQSAQELLAGLE